jgi:hypothetical protein
MHLNKPWITLRFPTDNPLPPTPENFVVTKKLVKTVVKHMACTMTEINAGQMVVGKVSEHSEQVGDGGIYEELLARKIRQICMARPDRRHGVL